MDNSFVRVIYSGRKEIVEYRKKSHDCQVDTRVQRPEFQCWNKTNQRGIWTLAVFHIDPVGQSMYYIISKIQDIVKPFQNRFKMAKWRIP